MTANESIKMLEIQKPAYGCKEYKKPLMYAYEMAIKALEEVQQYRAIGTPEELQVAREKQIAKKPTYEGDAYSDGQLVYDTWVCPCCGRSYELDYDDCDYCPNCGQNLDWSDLNKI